MAKIGEIVTDEYEIRIIAYRTNMQEISIRPLSGIEGTSIFGETAIGDKRVLNKETFIMNAYYEDYYKYDVFWNYMKSIIKDAMKWMEYWTEILPNRED